MHKKRKPIIGVMGPGEECSQEIADQAFKLGALLAKYDWVVLSGGRDMGVMDAVSKGAKSVNGTTIGILPNKQASISDHIDYAIVTDVNFARNNINVVTSDVVIAIGIGVGTASEIALALNAKKPVILLNSGKPAEQFFTELRPELIKIAKNPEDATELIREILKSQ